METGAIGAIFLTVVSPVEEEIKLKPDSVTVRHHLMEEQTAQDQILTLLLATIRNALELVKPLINYK
jgi:CII-binding regulator of phage lambda lysogenization HflD